MSDPALDELGPVDSVVVELPAGHANVTGEMAREMVQLVTNGTVRLLDLIVLKKDEHGTIEAFEIDDLDEVDELVGLEGAIAEILAAKDVARLAEAMENGTTAGVIVWENRWAVPFGAATRRAGGQMIASGRIPVQALAASLEADDESEGA